MKTVSLIFLFCICLGAGSSAQAQGASKCFRADWLQGERVVNFRVRGSRLNGTFVVGSGGRDTSADTTYEFSGALKGNTLTVTGRHAPHAPQDCWRRTSRAGLSLSTVVSTGTLPVGRAGACSASPCRRRSRG